MPNRFTSVAILIAWAVASAYLLRRDVLPDLLVGPPPDMRSIIRAQPEDLSSTNWVILVEDDRSDQQTPELRPAGATQTQTMRSQDGWVNLHSRTWFDATEVLRSTPLAPAAREQLEIVGIISIEPTGNLDSFRFGVRISGLSAEILTLEGKVSANDLLVKARGPIALLNWKRSFPYQPRQLVQNTLGPMEWMPGLQVGQRWISRAVSPLTGSVEEVSVAVERRRVITWDSNPVTTFEVVTRTGALSARTWVRPDGLVLRQELPLTFVTLLLERQAKWTNSPSSPSPEKPSP